MAGAAAGAGAVFLAAALAAGAAFLAEGLGTTWRAIGRGFGNGTFGLVRASAANADKPKASARLVANAVDRNAAARADGVTAFLRGESINRSSWVYLIEYVDKIPNTPMAPDVCATTTAKSRLRRLRGGPFA
jgi:hypothetical protein